MEIIRDIYVDGVYGGSFRLFKFSDTYWWRYYIIFNEEVPVLNLTNRKCLTYYSGLECPPDECTLIEFKEDDLE